MANPTPADFNRMLARLAPKLAHGARTGGVELESDLHAQIMDECDRRGWKYVRSRMDQPTTTAKGVPDFCILADGGVVHWVECKARGKSEALDQLCWHAHARKLGHTVHVVRSVQEFLEVVR